MTNYAEFTDSKLVELMAQDDHSAFSAIYNRYWKKLLHYALQKTGDAMEAENIVQDVFVSLWRRNGALNFSGEVSSYLAVSVKYRVIKLFHQQHRRRLYENTIPPAELLDDSTRQYLDFTELQQQLEQLVNSLPEKAQLIYRMNKEKDMSHRDIALELNMNEKAVNTQLVRARKTLRAGLNSFLHGFLL